MIDREMETSSPFFTQWGAVNGMWRHSPGERECSVQYSSRDGGKRGLLWLGSAKSVSRASSETVSRSLAGHTNSFLLPVICMRNVMYRSTWKGVVLWGDEMKR